MRLRTSALFCVFVALPMVAWGQASQRPCSVAGFARQTLDETTSLGHGLTQIPKNLVKPKNLAWEIPVAAATAFFITKVDQPADRRIQSPGMERTAGLWSNAGIGLGLASSAISYGVGCDHRDHYLRDTGFKALAAMGAAGAADLALKVAFDRQYPVNGVRSGEFWGGGRSFPSGHAAASFAFASVVAHRYPHKGWVKWGAYALATGISLSRYPAKKHYTSDILVGAALGYVTGAYLVNH